MAEIIVLSTTDTEELARDIALALVQEGEAACVSIVPGVRSIYRWEGKVCDDAEFLLLIKTSEGCFDGVRSLIRRLHTYKIPEIIALPVRTGDPDYLRWLSDQLKNSG